MNHRSLARRVGNAKGYGIAFLFHDQRAGSVNGYVVKSSGLPEIDACKAGGDLGGSLYCGSVAEDTPLFRKLFGGVMVQARGKDITVGSVCGPGLVRDGGGKKAVGYNVSAAAVV